MARKPVQYDPGVQPRQVTTQVTADAGYYRPTSPNVPRPDTSGMLRLARSLEVGAEKLAAKLETSQKIQDEKDREEAEQEAERVYLTKGIEEVRKMRKEGTLYPSDDPLLGAAMERQFGITLARNIRDEIKRRSNPGYEDSFDWHTTDADTVLREYATAAYQEMGDNRFASGGFSDTFGRFSTSLRDLLKQGASGAVAKEAGQAIFENVQNTIQMGIDNGATPGEIQEAVRSLYPGHTEAFGVTPSMQDKAVLQVAAVLAEQDGGNYELVKTLLMDERGKVGAIAGKADLAAKSQDIIERARKEAVTKDQEDHFSEALKIDEMVYEGQFTEGHAKRLNEMHPDRYTDAQLRTWVRQSKAARDRLAKERMEESDKMAKARAAALDESRRKSWLVHTFSNGDYLDLPLSFPYLKENGKEGVMKRDALQDEAIETWLSYSRKIAEEKGEAPEETFNRELRAFSANAAVHPIWSDKMKAGYAAANQESVTAETLMQNETFLEAYSLYEAIHAKAPQMVNSHLPNGPAQDLYETIRVLRKYTGASMAEATSQALRAERDPTQLSAVSRRVRFEELAHYANELKSSDKLFGFIGSNIDNVGEVQVTMERIANVYSLLGLDPKAAFKAAADRVKATHTVINHDLVFTADQRIPPTFPKLVEDHLSRFARTHNLDTDDLTVIPLGEGVGYWKVVLKGSYGTPVSDLSTKGLIFDLDFLNASEKKAAKKRKGEDLDDHNKRIVEDRLRRNSTGEHISRAKDFYKQYQK